MKSFIPIVLTASATFAAAQVTYNQDGTFTCAIANGAYCAGDSLQTNIIIRCDGTKGQPGNCNDNLSGNPPLGVNFAPCWQPSPTSGQAACSKNCIVYGGSGAYNGTFTLPNCTTSDSSTSSVVAGSSSSSSAASTSTVSAVIVTSLVPSGGASLPVTNGTVSTSAAGGSGSGIATATPVGPTSTLAGTSTTKTGAVVTVTGAAVANQAGAALAAGGLLMALFL